ASQINAVKVVFYGAGFKAPCYACGGEAAGAGKRILDTCGGVKQACAHIGGGQGEAVRAGVYAESTAPAFAAWAVRVRRKADRSRPERAYRRSKGARARAPRYAGGGIAYRHV